MTRVTESVPFIKNAKVASLDKEQNETQAHDLVIAILFALRFLFLDSRNH